jgi:formylmethanofuran:tetrahydromethanopterin formyltransferase
MSAPPASKSQPQSSASSSQDNVWVLAAAAAAGAAILGGAFWYMTSRKPASHHSAPIAVETKTDVEHVKPIKRIVLNADIACDDNEASKTADAVQFY